MAVLIKGPDISSVWMKLLPQILLHGDEVSPRNFETRELLNVTIEVENGLSNILYNHTRNLNYRFMIAEWLWIQAGLDDLETLATYNSVMRNFSDDGQILSGAYGPRFLNQLHYVVGKLREPGSRQAVMTIWTPNPTDSKDIPCTVSLQWFIRQDKIHCIVNMRSSDVWLGLPYDYFTFSQLTSYISHILNIEVGSVTMNLASSHIYSHHYEIGTTASIDNRCYTVHSPSFPKICPPSAEETIEILKQRALMDSFEGLSWETYAKILKNHRREALEELRGIDPTRKTE